MRGKKHDDLYHNRARGQVSKKELSLNSITEMIGVMKELEGYETNEG
jgi:hypothetical protein